MIHDGIMKEVIFQRLWESEKHFLLEFSRSPIVLFWKNRLLQTYYAIPLTLLYDANLYYKNLDFSGIN